MRNLLAVLAFISGIGLSIYVGAYLMLFKGAVQVINALNQTPVPAEQIGWGIVKIVFFETAGIFFILGYIVSMFLSTTETKNRKFKIKKGRK